MKRASVILESETEDMLHPELDTIQAQVTALAQKRIKTAQFHRYDDDAQPEPPEPPVIVPMSKGGVHIHPGDHNYYWDYLTILAQAGKPVSVVKTMEDGGLLEAKSASPQTVTIWRNTVDNDDFPSVNWHFATSEECKASARWWLSLCYPIWEKNPADYYEIINEPNQTTNEQLEWMIEWLITAIVDANSHGFKLGIGSFSSGCPSESHMIRMLDTVEMCAITGNILCMHDGATQDPLSFRASYPGSALRYRLWKQMADNAGKLFPQVALTEVYAYGNMNDPEYWNDWAWYLNEMKRDAYCLGACWFTIGDFGTVNFAGKPLMKYTELQLGI